MLLKSAVHLQTTVASRLDLEKRIGLQLGQAVLDDLLIPSFSLTGDTLFDVDTAKRIVTNYIQFELDVYPLMSDMERVGKLVESYLAEIASDRNLSVSKFGSFAELLPEQARFRDDGMYRAVDVYLKVASSITPYDFQRSITSFIFVIFGRCVSQKKSTQLSFFSFIITGSSCTE